MAIEKGKLQIKNLEQEDIKQVVNIHRTSFENSRSTKLGPPFLFRLYSWYFLHQPELSFVALYNDEIVGFVTGTLGWGGARKRFKFSLLQIILGLLKNPKLIITKEMYEEASNFIKAFINRDQNSQKNMKDISTKATLDSIAVIPKARGLKVGQNLISSFEDAAEKQGADYVALGVEYQNIAARYLYEKCGWSLFKENEDLNSASYQKYFSN